MKKLTHFPYNQVLVLGLARSGEAAAQLLYDSEIAFKINDLTPLEDNQVARHFHSLGVEVVTGHHPLSILDDVDLIVKNPGIPYDHKLVEGAEKRNIPVVTEIELAYRLIDGPIIAITGSNGKTTTTTLVHEVLNQAGINPLIAGNIGKVATQVAREQKEGQPVVMELSSFQLKAVQEFKPDIAVLLNITEAHLDYHKTMDDYVQSKLKITSNQTSNDILVYNQDDAYLSQGVKGSNAQLWPFSVKSHARTYVDNGLIYFNGEKVIDREDVALPGDHNLENVLVAIAIGKHFEVPNEVIKNVLKTFTGVKHRLQYVDTIHGRQFFNDSKATNVSASLKAIRAFNEPIVLIAGGLDRGNEFDDLVQSFDSVSHCVVYGESAKKIKQAAERNGFDSISRVDNLEQATNKAYEISQPGDIVLFSPACASWDQFKSFEERGDMFIELVHKFY